VEQRWRQFPFTSAIQEYPETLEVRQTYQATSDGPRRYEPRVAPKPDRMIGRDNGKYEVSDTAGLIGPIVPVPGRTVATAAGTHSLKTIMYFIGLEVKYRCQGKSRPVP
jgi:hypothetical protein